MILTKEEDIELIREAGRLAGAVLEMISRAAVPGITTYELDQMAEKAITDAGHIPTFKGYRGFPATVCASVNEEVVHGIPSKKKVLKDGDILSLDIGVSVRRMVDGKPFNFIGDTAITVPIGTVTKAVQNLLDATQRSLYEAIKVAKAGATLDQIGGAVEDVGKEGAYGIVRDYGGHGIGPDYHEDPFIFNYRTGSKTKLKPGMVIAIEPMFNQGGDKVRTKPDGWTVVTQDYRPSAHFEHSLLITDGDAEILTKRPNEVVG
ncbi:MAG: type I methionyl aminopeptidase [Cyanobacteria bacterium DS2.008]|mgnify:CR=1 FL=1|jgi:methionyl aminopeptidase|nr:type I methionyl aminopeptidase [Cyanobacteria bacterium DS2.008]MDQ5935075.1 Methionine aminopeptidase [Cyanobacteriota bacterium erpe_2018_sw_21hr_WHONDRS-SW48-000092_B_bin.40]